MQRECSSCGETKPLAEYYWRKDRQAFYRTCRACAREKSKLRFLRRNQKRRGITAEEHLEMYVRQQAKCAICGFQPQPHKPKLCIDHDHDTKKVRGLLCGWCNKALGLFRDNTVLLETAIRYINKSRETLP